MRLPEVKKEMHKLANILENGGTINPRYLHDLADQITRRQPLSRAQNTSQKITPELREQIRLFHLRKIQYDKYWTQQKTAEHFNVNPGRVSEAVRGKRQ